MVFDTTVYWALMELPRFQQDFERLEKSDAARAEKIRPYLQHLLGWDCKVTLDSTQATLCEAWYIELYGARYPGETLKDQFMADRVSRLDMLPKAAANLKSLYGKWKVPWGHVHRYQRRTKKPGVVEAAMAFSDRAPSAPSPGAPGPLGVIFTTYCAPGVKFIRPKQYAVVGPAYMAAIEFGDRIQSASLVPYGQSSDKSSPHYFDQATLLSQKKLKTAWLYRDDVKEHAVRSYRPGTETKAHASSSLEE
jgi:acyl-homoserine lactone acylase PvdQ